jgi:hypothetical protein
MAALRKRDIVAALLESSLYLETPLRDRLAMVNSLFDISRLGPDSGHDKP